MSILVFSTPTKSLYLELGCIDIETIIKSRRINYLHYLTKRNDDELIQRFFVAQWNYPHKHDWTEQVRKDLVDFKIPIDVEFIKSKSKSAFKNLVKSKSKEFAFERFICSKEKHSKLKNVDYDKLKMQQYLKENKFNTADARLIFKFRTRMAPFRENFKGSHQSNICPLCEEHPDDQNLVISCQFWINRGLQGSIEDIYSETPTKELVQTLAEMIAVRNNLAEDASDRPQVHS